nr:putative nucleotidyltransferase, ribonuclease H [Tanacetum cinerariifolium]
MGVTRETGVSSPTDLPILASSDPGVPRRATPTQFALCVDADTQESVVELLVLASSVVKLAICRRIARRTPLRVHLVRLIRSQVHQVAFSPSLRIMLLKPQDTRLVVPNDATLREALLTEAHSSPVSVHPGSTKMYHDLKQYFWWSGMKRDVATFVSRLKFSTAFHPQTDGQSERTIQTLEDMLRSCALEWTGNWDDYICLVEFAYNNSWHASIKCAPFEMLYGRKCRAPICWDQVGERVIEGPEMIEVTNAKVVVAKEKLKEARTRQKSYADKHHRALEF